jgi:hypothetical protein
MWDWVQGCNEHASKLPIDHMNALGRRNGWRPLHSRSSPQKNLSNTTAIVPMAFLRVDSCGEGCQHSVQMQLFSPTSALLKLSRR